MIAEILLSAAGSFLGCFGFAALVRAPRRSWVPASLIGMGAYMVFWGLAALGLSEPASIFCGSLAGSLAALICAQKMKMISTIFLMLSIVSFVPGLGLYRAMHSFGNAETLRGANEGTRAMITIAMIVFGQGVGSFIHRSFRRKPGHPHSDR
jgi:uncharacterized membrane protein YjjB (DUF3815 family)